MNYELQRLRKLERFLIPETASSYLTEGEISRKSELALRLYELHLEYKERINALIDRNHLTIDRIRRILDGGVI